MNRQFQNNSEENKGTQALQLAELIIVNYFLCHNNLSKHAYQARHQHHLKLFCGQAR